MICLACNFIIENGSKFCGNCGKKVELVNSCPECKIINPKGSKFCGGCGLSLINLSKSIEGEFIPMQNSLRISTSSGRNNDSGLYRKVTHPEEALLIAARNGNIDTVKTLLDSGVDADVTSPNSYTALGYAGIGGHLELMQLLIKHGADVNKQSRFMKKMFQDQKEVKIKCFWDKKFGKWTL